MPVEVKLPDLVRLGLVGEDEAAFNIRNMVRRLVKEGWIKSYREKTGVFLLAQKNGDDCVYLDSKTRRCTVYEKRPDTCREFPQKKGSRLGWCPYLPTTTS
jgi:Fe-S-cluster containining protein